MRCFLKIDKKIFSNVYHHLSFFFKKIGKNQAGQMLAETMVALTMIVIGLLGLLSLLSYAISLNKVIADQYVAAYLAAEGIEVVKNILDGKVADGNGFGLGNGYFEVDWGSSSPSFVASTKEEAKNSARFLTFNPLTKRYSYQSGSDLKETPFKRIIYLQQFANPEKVVVNSIVFWKTKGSGVFEINLEDAFFNWR